MPNAKDISDTPTQHKILVVGGSGSGKTSQVHSLSGRKFAYLFDPAALMSLQGLDIDYEQFLPDALELDSTLKGFNKGARDDKPPSAREPRVYMDWVDDLNKKHAAGFFKDYDWLIIDSLTLLSNAVMDRQMWLNNRYGGIEDLADYRVVGSKIADVFRSICSIPINLYCTGHINTFQDDKTKRLESQINLPGKARNMLPLLFSNIWELRSTTDDKMQYTLLTRPEPRGFQNIRSTIRNLPPVVDVTIKDFSRATEFGIGAMLKKHDTQVSTLVNLANARDFANKTQPQVSKDSPAVTGQRASSTA